ncbi:hypothetical protein OQ268_13470 [Pedobacter sandarakinus]|nr:hypothetical protein [Pedobacter sandarakinus]
MAQQNIAIDKDKLFDFYQSQKYADAAAYLTATYGDEVSDIKVINQIAYCYLMAGNLPDAEKYYLKAQALTPNSLPVLFSLGSINTRRGNTEKARTLYKQIVSIDSSNFSVYKLLANLYSSTKDSLKQVYLNKANLLNPQDADVAIDLAEVHAAYQKYDQAYEVLKVAIKADTQNLVLQRTILPLANQLKKYKEVIVSGQSLLMDGFDAGVAKDVAKAYYYTRNFSRAITLFTLLEEKGMQNENTLYFTSLSYRLLKNYIMAAVYAKKTIDEAISPNTANYYALLGLSYEEGGQYKLANAAYKKGLQFKTIPSIYYHLATLYDTKLNQPKTAKNYYNLYLKSKPDPKEDQAEIEFTKKRVAQLE